MVGTMGDMVALGVRQGSCGSHALGKPGGRGLEGFGVSVICGRACGGHAMLLPLLRYHSTPGALATRNNGAAYTS